MFTKEPMVDVGMGALTAPLPCTQAVDASRDRRLRALVDDHYDVVWRTLRRLGVAPGQVDDAAQEVFWVALRRLEDIRGGRERAFLFGVAARVASDSRRARARSREVADQVAVDGAVEGGPTPEGLLDERQARELLDEVLDALDDEARVVFVLFEIEGLSSPEIASLLELPVGTVASRLRRGRAQFREAAKRARARAARGGQS
jgi:RNA polymerase sigma-70 factor (ECF subfamily)